MAFLEDVHRNSSIQLQTLETTFSQQCLDSVLLAPSCLARHSVVSEVTDNALSSAGLSKAGFAMKAPLAVVDLSRCALDPPAGLPLGLLIAKVRADMMASCSGVE